MIIRIETENQIRYRKTGRGYYATYSENDPRHPVVGFGYVDDDGSRVFDQPMIESVPGLVDAGADELSAFFLAFRSTNVYVEPPKGPHNNGGPLAPPNPPQLDHRMFDDMVINGRLGDAGAFISNGDDADRFFDAFAEMDTALDFVRAFGFSPIAGQLFAFGRIDDNTYLDIMKFIHPDNAERTAEIDRQMSVARRTLAPIQDITTITKLT